MNIAPTRTLLLINVLAIAGLASLWVDQNGHLRQTAWVAPAPVKANLTALSLPKQSPSSDPSALAATLERPLFTPDRRPPPPALPPAPPPPPDPLADVQLLGLIAGQSGGVVIRAEGTVRRVSLTQKIGEWTLNAIADRTATFVRADETRTIRLEYSSLGMAAPAVAKQPPPTANGSVSAPASATGSNAAAQRQMAEEEAKNRDLAAMRARMSQTKP